MKLLSEYGNKQENSSELGTMSTNKPKMIKSNSQNDDHLGGFNFTLYFITIGQK